VLRFKVTNISGEDPEEVLGRFLMYTGTCELTLQYDLTCCSVRQSVAESQL